MRSFNDIENLHFLPLQVVFSNKKSKSNSKVLLQKIYAIFPQTCCNNKNLQGGRRYAKIIFVDIFPCHFLLEYSCGVLCCIEMGITSRQGIIIFIISSIHHHATDVLSSYISIILPINKSLNPWIFTHLFVTKLFGCVLSTISEEKLRHGPC